MRIFVVVFSVMFLGQMIVPSVMRSLQEQFIIVSPETVAFYLVSSLNNYLVLAFSIASALIAANETEGSHNSTKDLLARYLKLRIDRQGGIQTI